MVTKEAIIGTTSIGGNNPFVFIAGPCVIEDEETTYAIARAIKEVTSALAIPYIFKTSYDKANRSSLSSYRGLGMGKGLKILERVKTKYGVPVLSDVHRFEEIADGGAVKTGRGHQLAVGSIALPV